MCAMNMAGHMALTGGRVAVALAALGMGLSTFMVGVLVALFAMLPMVLSVRAGRLVDAIGVRRPLEVGLAMSLMGAVLPWVWPATAALLLAATLIGTGFMLQQVATQNQLGNSEHRLRNFSMLSLMQAVSGFCGPLITGAAIDHLGDRHAFGILAIPVALAMFGLFRLRRRFPPPAPLPPDEQPKAKPRMGDLVVIPDLRRVLMANMVISGAWDTHLFIVPVYGVSLGLSATTIGAVLSCFAAATFVIRVCLPYIQRRVAPWTLIAAAMLVAALGFSLYPIFDNVGMLMAMSFLVGLALGSSQPSLLALLHQHSPPGRAAEAAGIRLALINTTQMSVPMAFGAIGAAVGVAPLFWAYALVLVSGSWVTRKFASPPKATSRRE